MKAVAEFLAGLVLRRVLGGASRPAQRRARRAPAAAATSARAVPRPAPQGRPTGPLVPLVLGSLALGAVLMLVFEAWFTRLIGVLALFTFVVSGVFLIAGSGLLDPEEET